MDMNAFNALKTYQSAQGAIGGNKLAEKPSNESKDEFNPMGAAKEAVSSVVKSEQAAAAFMTGQADPHSVVEAIASAELAVETAVTLRNRVVEAYQELLRMPI